jgi:hypothetical protein
MLLRARILAEFVYRDFPGIRLLLYCGQLGIPNSSRS